MKNLIKTLMLLSLFLTACSHLQQSLDENITEPILKEEPKLIYPLNAQLNNRTGSSTIIFTVSKEGIVDQTKVHESSGYKNLDDAAESYCKGLVFDPALQNGIPISTNMKWEVKFNLEDFGREIKSKIGDVMNFYSDIENLEGQERFEIQNKILSHHKEIITDIKDGIRFNEYVHGVVQNNISEEWEPVSELYPLRFLLYHDFILRFPDYDSLAIVKSRLVNSLKQDINYLIVNKNIGYEYRVNKEALLNKIKSFVNNNYPEININSLISELREQNNSIS